MPNSNPSLASSSSSVPELTIGTLSVPTFEVSGNVFRRTGQSYFSRLDFESDVDNTYTPISGVDLIFGGTGFQVDASSDLYVGTIVDTERDAIAIPLPAVSLSTFYVASSVAPGTGETFTFTVYKNSTATAMTAQISGSGTSASYSATTITFSAGEKFSVRIVTSSGAQTAYLTYSVKLE